MVSHDASFKSDFSRHAKQNSFPLETQFLIGIFTYSLLDVTDLGSAVPLPLDLRFPPGGGGGIVVHPLFASKIKNLKGNAACREC